MPWFGSGKSAKQPRTFGRPNLNQYGEFPMLYWIEP